ncbi:MAG TPA: hypothetical protein VFX60_19325 [Micromonospora sp.]|nr:hypothetical protein [Micromonospora sp.]
MRIGAQRLAAELGRDRPPQGVQYCWMEPGEVTSVTAGAASDGNDLARVTYRGVTADAAYLAGYTPTVGHVVVLLIQSTGSVLILDQVIGTP